MIHIFKIQIFEHIGFNFLLQTDSLGSQPVTISNGKVTLAVSWTGTDIMQKYFTLALSGTKTRHLKAIELPLKHTTWKSFGTWKIPVPVQMRCERFYMEPYYPFNLVPVPVLVSETASVTKSSQQQKPHEVVYHTMNVADHLHFFWRSSVIGIVVCATFF